MFLPVDVDAFNDAVIAASGSEPRMAFNEDRDAEKVQEVDDAGRKGWTASVFYKHADDRAPSIVKVKLWSAADPAVQPGPIRFGGLKANAWGDRGKGGVSVTAGSFTQDIKAPVSKTPVSSSVPPKSKTSGQS